MDRAPGCSYTPAPDGPARQPLCAGFFSPAGKSVWDQDLCWAGFPSEEPMRLRLKPVCPYGRKNLVHPRLFSPRGLVCSSFCRVVGGGCGTSAMAPLVFACQSKQLAVLIEELLQIK